MQQETTAPAPETKEKKIARLLEEHPDLEHVPPGGYPSAKLAAKNIRAELKRAFPGVKFSVRSSTFSMGDSVTVSWDLGPTTRQVEEITMQYKEGRFDSSQDLYEYNEDDAFTRLFGGSKYVSSSRSIEAALQPVCGALCDLLGVPRPPDGHSYWQTPTQDVLTIARDLCCHHAFPVGAEGFGAELIPDRGENEEVPCHSLATRYRLTYQTRAK